MKRRGKIRIHILRLSRLRLPRGAGCACLLAALLLIGLRLPQKADAGRLLRLAFMLETGRAPRVAVSPSQTPAASASPKPPASPKPFFDVEKVEVTGDAAGEVDTAALFKEPSVRGESFTVLIIHTHSSESYTASENYEYTPTDVFRTEDRRYSVVRVGDELAAALEEKGFRVIHDREIYDWPTYSGSYSRSGAAVEEHLREDPDIGIVLDLHRDAFFEADGSAGRLPAFVNGVECAQLMLVAGTGSDGLEHPDWRENMSLALWLQAAAESLYPGLARPVCATGERYNQQLSPGSLILEVGSIGNTLPEALLSARLFASVMEAALG